MLADGVYMTVYENGEKVVVNYNDTEYTHNGTVIEPKGFARVVGKEG
jgi:hypothetical protein